MSVKSEEGWFGRVGEVRVEERRSAAKGRARFESLPARQVARRASPRRGSQPGACRGCIIHTLAEQPAAAGGGAPPPPRRVAVFSPLPVCLLPAQLPPSPASAPTPPPPHAANLTAGRVPRHTSTSTMAISLRDRQIGAAGPSALLCSARAPD